MKTKGRVAKTTDPMDKLQYFPVYDYDPPSLFLNELKVILDLYKLRVDIIRLINSIHFYFIFYCYKVMIDYMKDDIISIFFNSMYMHLILCGSH